MDFGLSAQQAMLQESVAQFLDRSSPLERVRQHCELRSQRADDLWSGLCDLGIPALIIAEEHGGIGCTLLDAALVAETLGSRVAPAPFVSTAVMAPLAIAAAGSEEQQARWLPALAEGKLVAGAVLSAAASNRLDDSVRATGAMLRGRALFVLDFAADIYLVADTERKLYVVEASDPGLHRSALSTIDRTRMLGELVFEDTAAELLPGSIDPQVCARVIEAGRIALAADTLGAASTMLERAVAYSKERVQFGRPVGSFQAVKHLCAEMAAELEPCRAMLWYAAHAFDALPQESPLNACHAKAHISEVGTRVARTSTEVHGGIGFTDELGLHLWFKRIGANRQLLGGPDQLREEAAGMQGLGVGIRG
jgi:alkylation response protein AidB-like acyl-CoA dehydrogenase